MLPELATQGGRQIRAIQCGSVRDQSDVIQIKADAEGTALYFIGGEDLPESAAIDQMIAWASLPPADDVARADLVSFDSLATMALSGVVGGAAWATFPAAAGWLRRRGERREPVEATEVFAAVRKCLVQVDADLARELQHDQLWVEADDLWHVRLSGVGRAVEVVADPSGTVVRIDLS